MNTSINPSIQFIHSLVHSRYCSLFMKFFTHSCYVWNYIVIDLLLYLVFMNSFIYSWLYITVIHLYSSMNHLYTIKIHVWAIINRTSDWPLIVKSCKIHIWFSSKLLHLFTSSSSQHTPSTISNSSELYVINVSLSHWWSFQRFKV